MRDIEYCAFGQRCGGCEAAGLASRTRAVEPLMSNVVAGVEEEVLEEVTRDWLKHIDPPKKAPNNPEVVSALANAATRIATGSCESYKYY